MTRDSRNKYSDSEGTVFFMRIQYRQNASWQGTLHWLDKSQTVCFRSALEMGMLIEEAMKQTKGQGDRTEPVVWVDKEEVS